MAQPAPQYGYVVALLPLTEAAATLDRLGEDGFLPAQITPLRGHDLLGTLAQRPASAAHPVPDTEVGHDPIMVVVLPVAEPEQRRRAEDLLTADGAAILGIVRQ